MDNYRILLAGRNRALIDHFFIQMDDEFECMTTSTRPEDILNHLDAVRFDAFLYCIQKEDREDYPMIMGYKDKFLRRGVAFMVAGYKEECDNFQKVTGRMAVNGYNIPIPMNEVKAAVKDAVKKRNMAMATIDAQINSMKAAGPASASDSDKSPASAPDSDNKTAASVQTESVDQAADESKKRVLVIDDDPMVLKLIKGHLGEHYDVASAISGRVAYKFMESKSVDLILLDYEMPEENGPQVYENIRKMDGEIRNVPIVFLTGVTEREKLVKALSLKPNGYLPKPINGTKLVSTVSKLIG